jgi:hypothetical protein
VLGAPASGSELWVIDFSDKPNEAVNWTYDDEGSSARMDVKFFRPPQTPVGYWYTGYFPASCRGAELRQVHQLWNYFQMHTASLYGGFDKSIAQNNVCCVVGYIVQFRMLLVQHVRQTRASSAMQHEYTHVT